MTGKGTLKLLIAGCMITTSVQIGYAEMDNNKQQPSFGLDEVVVTATKSEKTVMDAPGSVAVVTKKEIDKTNAKDIDEAIRTVAGVYDLRRKGFADTAPSINIRGLYGTTRNLVLIDGAPVGDDVWRRFPLELIDRVEVIKGPFSNLYGSNAMGGVVNIITRRPKDKLDVTIKAGFESNNSQTYEALVFGTADKWTYSVSMRERQTDGYVNNIVQKTPTAQATKPTTGTQIMGQQQTTDKYGNKIFTVGDAGNNYYIDHSCSFKLGRELSPDSNVQIDYTRTDYKYGYNGGQSYLKNASGNVFNNGSAYFYDTSDKNWKRMTLASTDFASTYGGDTVDLVNLSGKTKTGDLSLKGYVSYDNSSYWWVQPSLTAAYLQPSWTKNTKAEVSASKPLPYQQTVTVGVSVVRTDYELKQQNLSDWNDRDSVTTLTQDLNGATISPGIFIQDELAYFDPLTVYIGARYDMWQAFYGSNYIVKNNVAQSYSFDNRSENNVSPRVSLVYKLSDDSRVKASVGQSFRGPTPSELYSGYSSVASGVASLYLSSPDLKPEKVVSGECSYEKTFADKVSCTVTYFMNQMSDYIYTKSFATGEITAYNSANAANFAAISQKQNLGKSQSQGLELEAKAKIFKSFDAFVSGTLMSTEVKENPTNQASVGKKIPNIPETMASAGVDYVYNGLTASVIGRYQGKIYGADDNSDTVTGVYGAYDPFFLVDAKVSYSREISGYIPTISLVCNNIFDKVYYEYYLSPGVTFGVNLSISRKF